MIPAQEIKSLKEQFQIIQRVASIVEIKTGTDKRTLRAKVTEIENALEEIKVLLN